METKGTEIDSDKKLLKFATYEEYLDSLVRPIDLFYLRNTEIARRTAELGYRSTGETLNRGTFNNRKNRVKNLLFPIWRPFTLDSELTGVTDNSLIVELSLRERSNRLGVISTVIFVRILTKSLTEGRRKLSPRPTDLSYYNWRTKKLLLNKTSNYEPLVDPTGGLILRNLHDRKYIDLNPKASLGPDTSRLLVDSNDYRQIVLYDHTVSSRN